MATGAATWPNRGLCSSSTISTPEACLVVETVAATMGIYTLQVIREESRKPARDPRHNVHERKDLAPGMVLEGVVANVTKFVAFVDIDVHRDGIVHIGELSVRNIKEPTPSSSASRFRSKRCKRPQPQAKPQPSAVVVESEVGMNLDNYKLVLYRNQPDGWVADVPAIEGCYALMPTREEALAEIEQVFEMIAVEYCAKGIHMPEDNTSIVHA